ncbi:MAG: hypothetical protein H0U60_14230 [Blastocatellia bacterium]|nr:hypothetical protein [Blastocatellia bacterium]
MKLVTILFLTAMLSVTAVAQRPRAVDTATDASKAVPAAPPQSMKAKYEGGVFGHSHTMEGTLSFDDANARLLFRKDGKDVFFIPYNAVNSAFADTQKKRPGAATVASNVPYLGFPLGLIKTKVRYLTVQFSDPDTLVSGVTSFRLENQGLVDSALYALARKSGLVPRGEVYVRKRDNEEANKTNP